MNGPTPPRPAPGTAAAALVAPRSPRAAAWLAGGLALWFALAAAAAASGLFAVEATQSVRPLPIAATAPVVVFLFAYAVSARLRRFVLGADPVALTVLQGWRVLGFGFLPLYAYGALPGLFALPAGLGDVAVGLSAPVVAWACARRPGFARGRGFALWNLLGLADFAVALGLGTLPGPALGLFPDAPAASAMETWPLALIPAFAVPVFAGLHLAALFKARALARAAVPAG